jgi:hypothetical protein
MRLRNRWRSSPAHTAPMQPELRRGERFPICPRPACGARRFGPRPPLSSPRLADGLPLPTPSWPPVAWPDGSPAPPTPPASRLRWALAELLILGCILGLGPLQQRVEFILQLFLRFAHAPITHRLVFARVRLQLGPVDGHMTQLHQPCLPAQLQSLRKNSDRWSVISDQRSLAKLMRLRFENSRREARAVRSVSRESRRRVLAWPRAAS